MIQDCPKCKRKKVIMGLGAMLVTCPECKGVGHVKLEDKKESCSNDEKVAEFLVEETVIPIVRRGRPKRDKNERIEV